MWSTWEFCTVSSKGYSIPKSNFCSKDSIIAGKMTKKQSKSKSKIPKIVGEKRNFSPFRTGSKIADLLGRLTIINVQRKIFSVWLKRLWSEDGSSLSSRPSNKSIGDKLSLSACEGAQTYLLKPYDSDQILTRQASSTWNGIKANMLHRKFCSLLIDGVITLSIK